MGRWARKEIERQIYTKVAALFEKAVADDPTCQDADLRLATFIEHLDPEDKVAQACFSTLVQQLASNVRHNEPYQVEPPRFSIDILNRPVPRASSSSSSSARPRSPFPFRPYLGVTSPTTRSSTPTVDFDTTTAAGASYDALPISSREGSLSAQRRSITPRPRRDNDSRPHTPRPRGASHLPTPSEAIENAWINSNLNDMTIPALDPVRQDYPVSGLRRRRRRSSVTSEAGPSGSPPHAPSDAWLNEWSGNGGVPQSPTSVPPRRWMHRQHTGAVPIAAHNQASTRTDERPRQRRRVYQSAISHDGYATFLPSLPRSPTLRRTDSSRRLRDEAAAVDGEAQRDTRRDGVVFDVLAPALPSSAISAASETDPLLRRVGPSQGGAIFANTDERGDVRASATAEGSNLFEFDPLHIPNMDETSEVDRIWGPYQSLTASQRRLAGMRDDSSQDGTIVDGPVNAPLPRGTIGATRSAADEDMVVFEYLQSAVDASPSLSSLASQSVNVVSSDQ